ncbi:FecR family protein [Pseudomonas sp.]|uniref:FecR family protein n=1 Tax=Pseudomonas sp. TaxID=306 RepID=UPI002734BF17|nr:FecR family protein [Pseudomonas sp.]MDP3816756.1 FecR family protein [Pseudomonas sp.]
MQRLFWPSAALWLVLMLGLLPAQAAEEAAQVILAHGAQALGADGALRTLARRDRVFVGDTLSTAGNAMLQVRFVDKALLTLRENSQFRIETYTPPTDGGGQVLMHLVEGGFRTITGSIGKGSQDSYRVTTGAASIGIRGTHYEVVQESPNAIVVAVWDGGIHLSNANGSLNLGPDLDFSYSRVETGQAPAGLLEPPPAFQQGPAATQAQPESAEEVAESDNASPDDGAAADGAKEAGAEPAEDSEETAIFAAQATTTEAADQEEPALSPSQEEILVTLDAPLDDSLNLTDTNQQLQEELTPPPVPVDPWTTKALTEPRLYIAEFDQLKEPAKQQAVIVADDHEVILATLISPDAPSLYDFAANGPVSFELHYAIEDGSNAPPGGMVLVQLDKNHPNLNAVIGDIQEDLSAAGAPVGVRESTLNPGHLEFFTANANPDLQFKLSNFDYSASSAQPLDVANALGGLVADSFAFGHSPGDARRALVVFGQDGKPSAFLAPNPPTASGSSTSNSPTAALGVGRQGASLLQDYNPAVDGRSNISWGRWAASASNPIHIYGDIDTPETITEFREQSGYWLAAEAANTTALTGTQRFQMGATPQFLGSGSDGAVQAMGGAFTVDFTTGAVSNGSLSLSTANQNWSAQFNGVYADAHAFMRVNNGTISGSVNCANCVSGNINGIFVAPGDRFAAGYNLYQSDQPSVNNQGVFLMERQ